MAFSLPRLLAVSQLPMCLFTKIVSTRLDFSTRFWFTFRFTDKYLRWYVKIVSTVAVASQLLSCALTTHLLGTHK